ncbi:MAG: hypothetical protein ACRDQB_11710 [Thermocrispum sp.]
MNAATVMVIAGSLTTGSFALLVILRALRSDARRGNREAVVKPPPAPKPAGIPQHGNEWATQHISVAEILRREAADAPLWPAARPARRT